MVPVEFSIHDCRLYENGKQTVLFYYPNPIHTEKYAKTPSLPLAKMTNSSVNANLTGSKKIEMPVPVEQMDPAFFFSSYAGRKITSGGIGAFSS